MEGLSAQGFRDAMEGPFWKEMKASIESWIPDLQAMLEDIDAEYEQKDYQQARGSLRALRNVLIQPTILLEGKEHASKQQGEE